MRVLRLLPTAVAFLVTLITAALWWDTGESQNPSGASGAASKPSPEPTQTAAPRTPDLRASKAEAIQSAAPPAFPRSVLAAAIDTHLPDLKLSDTELDDLADATSRLREAQEALRRLPDVRERATQRAEARQRLADAIADFTYVVGMSPAEFTRRVQPEIGIDREGANPADSEPLIRPIPVNGESP